MNMQRALISVCGWSMLVAAIGCGGSQPSVEEPVMAEPPAPPPEPPPAEPPPMEEPAPAAEPAAAPRTIEVAIQAKSGSKLTGTATFTEVPEGVKVAISVENVKAGEHGTHVHEKGDCSAPDAKSAGDHFNPGGHPHALPEKSPRHLGDLGNIMVGKDGKGTHEVVAAGANLKDDDGNSFVGRALIVHEKKDDGGQPTGNAGGRIGCAEIK